MDAIHAKQIELFISIIPPSKQIAQKLAAKKERNDEQTNKQHKDIRRKKSQKEHKVSTDSNEFSMSRIERIITTHTVNIHRLLFYCRLERIERRRKMKSI